MNSEILQMVDSQEACGGLVRDTQEREILRRVGGGGISIGRAAGQ